MTVVGRAGHNCSLCIVVRMCFCLRRRNYEGGKEKCYWLNRFVGRAGQKSLISIVVRVFLFTKEIRAQRKHTSLCVTSVLMPQG